MKNFYLMIFLFLITLSSCTTITVPPSDLDEAVTIEDSRGAIVTLQSIAGILPDNESLSTKHNTAYVGLNFDMTNLDSKRMKLNLSKIYLKVINTEGLKEKVIAYDPYAISSLGSSKLVGYPRKLIKTMGNPQYFHIYYLYPKNFEIVSLILDDKTEIYITQDKHKQNLPILRFFTSDDKDPEYSTFVNIKNDDNIQYGSTITLEKNKDFGFARYLVNKYIDNDSGDPSVEFVTNTECYFYKEGDLLTLEFEDHTLSGEYKVNELIINGDNFKLNEN